MADPFQRMHDSTFRRLGVDAIYTPPGGDPSNCRAIFIQPDVDWRGGEGAVTTPSRIAEVRVSEVAEMKERGRLTIGGQSFTVQKASRPDADRLLWRLELR